MTFEELVEYKHSTRMELADRILDELIRAARSGGGDLARRAADVLETWDRHADSDSQGGVLFAQWAWSLRHDLPDMFATPWSADAPRTTPDGLADSARAVEALETVARQLEESFGRLDVPYGEFFRLRDGGHDLPGNGGPGSLGIFRVIAYGRANDGRYQAIGGDSFVAAVEFSDPVRAQVVLSPGNASQADSAHNGDQLELVSEKKLRPAWRSRSEIERNLESRETIEQ